MGSEANPKVRELSKVLFGQTHRLALMIAISRARARVNPTDLARELDVVQSAIQAPMRDLIDAELLVEAEPENGRHMYERAESAVWAWIDELAESLEVEEARSKMRAS